MRPKQFKLPDHEQRFLGFYFLIPATPRALLHMLDLYDDWAISRHIVRSAILVIQITK